VWYYITCKYRLLNYQKFSTYLELVHHKKRYRKIVFFVWLRLRVLVVGVVVVFLVRKKLCNLVGQDNDPAGDDAYDTLKKFPHGLVSIS